MDVLMLSNFNVNTASAYAGFTSTGWWYEYYTGDSIEVSNVNMQLELQPAEYRIYTTTKLDLPEITSTVSLEELTNSVEELFLYPNPTQDVLNVKFSSDIQSTINIKIIDEKGSVVMEKNPNTSDFQELVLSINISDLSSGSYCILVKTDKGFSNSYFVKL
jgi:hypothetical protein